MSKTFDCSSAQVTLGNDTAACIKASFPPPPPRPGRGKGSGGSKEQAGDGSGAKAGDLCGVEAGAGARRSRSDATEDLQTPALGGRACKRICQPSPVQSPVTPAAQGPGRVPHPASLGDTKGGTPPAGGISLTKGVKPRLCSLLGGGAAGRARGSSSSEAVGSGGRVASQAGSKEGEKELTPGADIGSRGDSKSATEAPTNKERCSPGVASRPGGPMAGTSGMTRVQASAAKVEAVGTPCRAPTGQGQPESKRLKAAGQELPFQCMACGRSNRFIFLLRCEACSNACHLACCQPPLTSVPKGKWFCSCCQPLAQLHDIERLLDAREVPGNTPRFQNLLSTWAHSSRHHRVLQAAQEGPAAAAQAGSATGPGGAKGTRAEDLKTAGAAAGAAVGAAASGTAGARRDEAAAGGKGAAGPAAPLRREVLVKWRSRSYRHCTWLPEKAVEDSFSRVPGLKSRLARFWAQRAEEGEQADDDGEGEEGAGEFLNGVNSQWTLVDRIIAERAGQPGQGKGAVAGAAEPSFLVKWRELGYEQCTWEAVAEMGEFEEEVAAFRARTPIVADAQARALVYTAQQRLSQSQPGSAPGPTSPTPGSASTALPLASSSEDPGGPGQAALGSRKFSGTPDWLRGGQLHGYQLEGLNWLFHKWSSGDNVILADEMGLGKTVQAIALLAALHAVAFVPRPSLLVVPLSTLRNWEREFKTWAPHLNVVTLNGNAAARKTILEHELLAPPVAGQRKTEGVAERVKFHALLTSYEMLVAEAGPLCRSLRLEWEVLVVDEGHRLKNKDSRLFQELKAFKPKFKLLLTGTPLQNKLGELFMLMHFLEPAKFESQEQFEQQFSDLAREQQVSMLHTQLEPHLLRRMKKDVLRGMPPKQEQIVRVELTATQRGIYKQLLARHFPMLARGGISALANVVMQLRKCCAHPYLFGEEGASASASDATEQLVACSGKLQLLDTLMGRLIARGHRTLIYSQFTRVLDILEDWLAARHWPALRIDGTIPGAERQRRIDRFNQQPEAFKVFLLSTRAGGVGINLATADTVIIFDSDWNPHNDLQAAARAHRLGQVRPVMVYRLVTRATIEERMMQVSRKKLALEYLVVRKLGEGARGKLKQSELDDILRYGAQELFADEEGAGDDAGADGGVKPDVDKPGAAADGCEAAATGKRIVWDDEALDRLLDRSGMESAATTTEADGEQGGAGAGGADDLFGAFKVAHYNMDTDDTTRIAAAAAAALLKRTGGEPGELPAILQGEGGNLPAAVAQEGGQAGPAFWKDLLSDHWKAEYEAEQAKLGRGRRGRRQVDYADNKVWATIDTSDDEGDSDNSDDSDDSDASRDSGSCKPRNADAGDDGDEDFRVEDHEEGLNEEEDEEEEEEYVELEPEAALGPKRGRKPKTATSQTAKQRQHLGAQVSLVVDQAGQGGAVPIVAEAQPAGTGKADIVKKEHNWLTTMQERLEGLKKAVPAQLEGKQQLQEQKQEKEQNRKQEQEKQQQEQRRKQEEEQKRKQEEEQKRKQEEEQKRKQEQEQRRKQEQAKQHQEQRHKQEEEQKRKQEEEQKRKQEQEEQRRKQEQEKQQQEQRRKQEEEQRRKQEQAKQHQEQRRKEEQKRKQQQEQELRVQEQKRKQAEEQRRKQQQEEQLQEQKRKEQEKQKRKEQEDKQKQEKQQQEQRRKQEEEQKREQEEMEQLEQQLQAQQHATTTAFSSLSVRLELLMQKLMQPKQQQEKQQQEQEQEVQEQKRKQKEEEQKRKQQQEQEQQVQERKQQEEQKRKQQQEQQAAPPPPLTCPIFSATPLASLTAVTPAACGNLAVAPRTEVATSQTIAALNLTQQWQQLQEQKHKEQEKQKRKQQEKEQMRKQEQEMKLQEKKRKKEQKRKQQQEQEQQAAPSPPPMFPTLAATPLASLTAVIPAAADNTATAPRVEVGTSQTIAAPDSADAASTDQNMKLLREMWFDMKMEMKEVKEMMRAVMRKVDALSSPSGEAQV